MPLESAKGLPAYNVPQNIKKQSWAKKKKKRKNKRSVAILSEVYKI